VSIRRYRASRWCYIASSWYDCVGSVRYGAGFLDLRYLGVGSVYCKHLQWPSGYWYTGYCGRGTEP
jgi:hypothetical protein